MKRNFILLMVFAPIVLFGSFGFNGVSTNNQCKMNDETLLRDYPARKSVMTIVTDVNGCWTWAIGTIDESGIAGTFIGTVGVGGPAVGYPGPCAQGTWPVNYSLPVGPDHVNPVAINFTLEGGDDFCSATDMVFASYSTVPQDAVDQLNRNSKSIFDGIKEDCGC